MHINSFPHSIWLVKHNRALTFRGEFNSFKEREDDLDKGMEMEASLITVHPNRYREITNLKFFQLLGILDL